MNLKELNSFKLSDAIGLHSELNPVLFKNDKLKPQVREGLLLIAQDFLQHLGINDLDVQDITLSGSNAAYSYTPHSDVDVHLIVDIDKLPQSDVYRELFDAKKNVFNDTHDIKIGGYDVELYVQDSKQPHVSLGDYSIMNDSWNKHPVKRRANFDMPATKLKYEKLEALALAAIENADLDQIENVLKTIKKYRKAGLDEHGEFGPENLSYKGLRTRGIFQALIDRKNELHSEQLSLNEASGYIPSEREKNDPRFSTALTVDVKPNAIKKNAKAFGFKVSRAGIPPLLKP